VVEDFGRSKSQTPLVLRRSALASLGLAMQEEEVWAFPRARWIELITRELHLFREGATPGERVEVQYITPDDVHEEIKHSGLLRYSDDRAWVEFAHHTYQEFFAALAQREQGQDLEPAYAPPKPVAAGRAQLCCSTALPTITPPFTPKSWPGGRFMLVFGWPPNAWQIRARKSARHCAAWNSACRRNSTSLCFLASAWPAANWVATAEALTYLNTATEEEPGSAEVQYELGSLYRQVDQLSEPSSISKKLSAFALILWTPTISLASLTNDQGKYVEALTFLRPQLNLSRLTLTIFITWGQSKRRCVIMSPPANPSAMLATNPTILKPGYSSIFWKRRWPPA